MDEILIRNNCSLEQVDPRFLPLIERARAGMLACCCAQVHEIRLQGSIARGDAEVCLSDLDVIALVDGSPTDEQRRCLEELAASLGATTDLVSRFDLEAVDANRLEPFQHFVLTSDSLCIHGVDTLTLPVQTMERLALARLVTPDPVAILPDYLDWVEELTSAGDAERRFASRIIGKDLLKVLRGVLLLRGAPYEVAVPRLAVQVRDLAPEAAEVAAHLFALYSEPTTDQEAIRRTAYAASSVLTHSPDLARLHSAGNAAPGSLGETSP